MPPRHWLAKSEPDVFSFSDLLARPRRTEPWDGVRNFRARNYLRQMAAGDLVLFYHSRTTPPHVAGIAEVVREAYPDASAWDPASPVYDPRSTPSDPRWFTVDVRAVRRLEAAVTLAELKGNPRLAGMAVVRRGQRLSVMPVGAEEFAEVLRMARGKAAIQSAVSLSATTVRSS